MKRLKASLIIIFAVIFVFSFALSAAAIQSNEFSGVIHQGVGDYTWTGRWTDVGCTCGPHTATDTVYKYVSNNDDSFYTYHNFTCSSTSHNGSLKTPFATKPLQTALNTNNIDITLYDNFHTQDGTNSLYIEDKVVKVNIGVYDFGSADNSVHLKNNSKLTVSGTTGKATIRGEADTSELIVEGGNVYIYGTFKSITVKGGTVSGNSIIFNSGSGTPITVSGGSISLYGNNIGNSTLSGADNALIVTGGTANLTDYNLKSNTGSALKISGGVANLLYNNNNASIQNSDGSTPAIKITGGTVNLNDNTSADNRNVSISSASNTCIENTGGKLVYAKADISLNNSAFSECYGIKASGASAVTTIKGGNIAITNRGANSNAYGVYLDNSAQLSLTGGSIMLQANNTVSYTANASIIGIENKSGAIFINGGSISADTAGASVAAYAIKNESSSDSRFISGTAHVTGTDDKAAAVFNAGRLSFTGGSITASGKYTSAVKNSGNSAAFAMGVHDGEIDRNASPGQAGYPSIEANGDFAFGFYNENGRAQFFTGKVSASGANVTGIRAVSGNVQVLAGKHSLSVDNSTGIVFRANCAGQNSTAFYIEDASWAIRGSGSLFSATTALCVKDTSKTDGGLYADKYCTATNLSSSCAPLSGGTFSGSVECLSGQISNILIDNYYIRDDSSVSDPDEYCRISQGGGVALNTKTNKLDGSNGKVYTITNALWEVRYAFLIPDGNFALPCDIDLGATNGGTLQRHGFPDISAGPITISDGSHILDLNGHTLKYASGSVINVAGGELTVVNSKQSSSASADAGSVFMSGSGDAITVSGGVLNIGTAQNKAAVTSAGTSAVKITGGVVNVNSGYIGETKEGKPTNGIIQNGGTLNVFGLTSNGTELPTAGTDRTIIFGKENDLYIKDSDSSVCTANINGGSFTSGTYGICVENANPESAVNVINPYLVCGSGAKEATGLYIKSGNVKVSGGNILFKDALTNAAIRLNGENAYLLISAENPHNIGVVEAKNGRLDIADARTKIYAVNASEKGSVLLTGGTVSSDSSFEGTSELLATGGTFAANLRLTGSSRAVFTADGDGAGASVLGTLTVNDSKASGANGITDEVVLLIDKGTFNSVTRQYKDGNSVIELHGGLYKNLTNSTVGSQHMNISENRYSALLEDGTTKIKTNSMLTYGHFVVGNSTGKMYNTALTAVSTDAAGGDEYMRVRHITDDESEYNIYAVLTGKTSSKTYKMPADIDLTALANNEVAYTFRGADRSFSCGSSEARTVPLTIKSGSYTLDLNGYELTASEEGKSPLQIDGGSLTIIDTAETNLSNFFGNVWDGAGDSTILINSGTLSLESGKLVNSKASVVEMSGGTFNVKGGQIDSLAGNSVYMTSGLVNVSGGVLSTTTGSNVKATGGNVYVSGSTLRADSGTSLSMSGDSSLSVSGGAISAYSIGIKHNSTGDLNISGGNIDGRSVAVSVDNHVANVAVSNGVIGYDSNTEYGLIVENANTVRLTGGLYKSITTNDPELKTLASLVPFGSTMDTDSKPYGIKASAVSANGTLSYSTTNSSIISLISANEPDAPSLYLSETQITGAADLTDNTVSFGSFTPDTAKSVKVYTYEKFWDKDRNSKPDDSTVLAIKYSLSEKAPVETNYIYVSDGGKTYDVIKHWIYHPMFEVTGESDPAKETPVVIDPTPETPAETPTNNNNNTGNNNNQNTTTPTYYPPYAVAYYNYMPSTLNVQTHIAYLQGFAGGVFNADAGLTRAQAACVFYRLLENQNTTGSSNFKDVPKSHWAYKEINALSQRGIINGYSDGTFKPNKYITRAEFCAIATRFFNLRPVTKQFSDVPSSHWAYNYICSAASYDWVNGMGGGMFYPDYNITRGQSVKIVNSMLGRKADQNYVNTRLSSKYKDLAKTHIFYYDILEASTEHKYIKDNDGETWVSHS
jgi:hypothetical protein